MYNKAIRSTNGLMLQPSYLFALAFGSFVNTMQMNYNNLAPNTNNMNTPNVPNYSPQPGWNQMNNLQSGQQNPSLQFGPNPNGIQFGQSNPSNMQSNQSPVGPYANNLQPGTFSSNQQQRLSNLPLGYQSSNQNNANRYEWITLQQFRNVISFSGSHDPLTNTTELMALVQDSPYSGSYSSQNQAKLHKLKQDRDPLTVSSVFEEVPGKRSASPRSSYGRPKLPSSVIAVGPFESWGVTKEGRRNVIVRCVNPCNGEWNVQPFYPIDSGNNQNNNYNQFRNPHNQYGGRQNINNGQSNNDMKIQLSSKYALILLHQRQLYRMSLFREDHTQTGRNWELISQDRHLSSVAISPSHTIFAVESPSGKLLKYTDNTSWTPVSLPDTLILDQVAAGREMLAGVDRGGLVYSAGINATRAEEWVRLDGARGATALSVMSMLGNDTILLTNTDGQVVFGKPK